MLKSKLFFMCIIFAAGTTHATSNWQTQFAHAIDVMFSFRQAPSIPLPPLDSQGHRNNFAEFETFGNSPISARSSQIIDSVVSDFIDIRNQIPALTMSLSENYK